MLCASQPYLAASVAAATPDVRRTLRNGSTVSAESNRSAGYGSSQSGWHAHRCRGVGHGALTPRGSGTRPQSRVSTLDELLVHLRTDLLPSSTACGNGSRKVIHRRGDSRPARRSFRETSRPCGGSCDARSRSCAMKRYVKGESRRRSARRHGGGRCSPFGAGVPPRPGADRYDPSHQSMT
jgi:hypothetical protein